jgi:hypothetical protein
MHYLLDLLFRSHLRVGVDRQRHPVMNIAKRKTSACVEEMRDNYVPHHLPY